MKVLFYNFTLEDDWREAVVVRVDGKKVMSFYDGEPEDNSLMRNFNDIYSLPDLLKRAYEAGKKGEEFSVESKKIDPDDE